MIKADIITGLLGAGKTTFLLKYARYLMEQGLHIGVLVNDYGAVNVDMLLLQELIGDECELEMVIGGDYECHRRRFKTKMIALAMSGCERVIIEPSGIYDVDEFFDVLHEEPLDRWYSPGNVISIIDAGLPEDLSVETEYLLASQTSDSGIVLMSRSQDSTAEKMESTIKHLNKVMATFYCDRRFGTDVVTKPWDELSSDDMKKIDSCGYRIHSHVKLPVERSNEYSSCYYMGMEISLPELKEKAREILGDPSCGNVIRIKGFTRINGEWYEINATKDSLDLKPVERGQAVLIVIGENLNKGRIDAYWTIK